MASEVLARTIAVVGPTASGKTALALALAKRLGGEIVSADMGQMYRLLDAGTAKPAGSWDGGVYRVEGVPYHLVDALDPAEPTDAGRFAELARPVLDGITGRGRPGIVAGGTGLYVRSLIEGLDPLPRRDAAVRARIERRAEAGPEGRRSLHRELARRDPAAAKAIPAANLRRVVRALEVIELTGRPISEQWTLRAGRRTASAGSAPVYLGIRWENEALKRRIRGRAEEMFPLMIKEVAALIDSRYTGDEPGFRCLGYPEAVACARGELSAERGLERMVKSTVAYAKRQRTWFRRQTPAHWLEGGMDQESLVAEALNAWAPRARASGAEALRIAAWKK
ncbi:MAG: tRNA (adenosine(37)-N6)-dimethylallyltransferase MiaA [Elusimicrobiota bacterium]